MSIAKAPAKQLQEKEYRLLGDGTPISAIVKTGSSGTLLTFDKTLQHNRAIRHCRNEKSIYIDEQSKFAVVDPIIFEYGYFKTLATDVTTQNFLDASPENKANGGSIFEIVDEEQVAEDSLDREDLVADLRMAVREKQEEEDGLYELQAIASVIQDSHVKASKLSKPELRRIIYDAINNNPYEYIDEDGNITLFDESVKRKYLALRAIGEGLIVVTPDGRSIIWGDNKNLITGIPSGRSSTEYFAEYLATDDGMLVLDKIVKSL